MSGILHRLAARAVGTAVTARADARLRGGTVGVGPDLGVAGAGWGVGGMQGADAAGQGGAVGAFEGGAQAGSWREHDAQGFGAQEFGGQGFGAGGSGAAGRDARGRGALGLDPSGRARGPGVGGGVSSGLGLGFGAGSGDAWRVSWDTGGGVPTRLLDLPAGASHGADSLKKTTGLPSAMADASSSSGAGSSRTLSASTNEARGAFDAANGVQGDGRATSNVGGFGEAGVLGHHAVYPTRLLTSNGSLSTSTVSLLSDTRVQATVRAVARDMAAGIAAAQAASAAPGTDTEITIHIGRIDVTATRAPAARPVKAPAQAATAMSLDTYLSRRQRSGT
ncbi:hypothetical protein [Pigmentiphaga litoralis]|uniref:hypothetical protein n=1 Tax=Pigmentiphaga litoralis TaxID=516702 RepID=UPI003B42CB7E